MFAVLAAATLAAAQPAPRAEVGVYRDTAARTAPQTICKQHGVIEAKAAGPALLYRNDGQQLAWRLHKLPKADHEKAVARSIGGCAAPLVVRHAVGP